MASKVFTTTLLGIDAVRVEVEAQISAGKRRFSIVGLPDGVLREARERVRCAIENCGFDFPAGDVVVSMSPASLPKSGASFDLAVALSVLSAARCVRPDRFPNSLFCGELTLAGDVRPSPGILASACLASQYKWALVGHPAALAATRPVLGLSRIAVTSLSQVVRWLNSTDDMTSPSLTISGCESDSGAEHSACDVEHDDRTPEDFQSPDFRDVIGQHVARRAAVVAAAGRHNLFLLGPPGSGKSMLAKRIPSILPRLSSEEALELAKVRGACPCIGFGGSGVLGPNTSLNAKASGGDSSRPSDSAAPLIHIPESLTFNAPFRAPHHSISCAGLVGGGAQPIPGEVSLAHRGVLFLDELLEFRRDTLEALRQPLEDRKVLIRRVHFRVEYPADVMLVAAANPCPCGALGGQNRCRCSSTALLRYRQRLSGPLLDRVDLQVWVPPISVRELHLEVPERDPTTEMRHLVMIARAMQHDRVRGGRQTGLNYTLAGSELRDVCRVGSSGRRILEEAARRLSLSARGHARILRVARSIADLSGAAEIQNEHLAEAISYRLSDWAVDVSAQPRTSLEGM